MATRQLWLQIVVAQKIAASPYNPRSSLLAAYRGSIVAREDTVLARSTAHGRVYPLGPELAQTLGYSSQRYGTAGLERTFDAELSAPVGGNDIMTQVQSLLGRTVQTRGATVVTTIDPVVEQTLYDALLPYERAAGVAIDPRNGEILALASVPSFDPQSIDADFAALRDDPRSVLLNRAIDGLYPPGSTFKIFTAASALEAGVVTPTSTFADPGWLAVGPFVLHDDEGEATGTQDLTGAFAKSSNVDFAQIALQLGADRWFEDAAKWRLGEPVRLELPAQTDRLPTRSEMTPSLLAQLGFGEADLLVTPLRMALVAATIAAGGIEPHPHLVRALRDPWGAQRTLDPGPPLAQPISAQTADTVRSLMIAVVAHGTGTAAALPDITVAGKTGTATNPAGRSHAWFVAFAPAEAPRVAVAVVVENVGYGGTYAAPIARRVLRAALARGST